MDQGAAGASIVWSTPLGEVACPVGKCRAQAADVAVDPGGGVWVEAELLLPSQMLITDDHSHGLGLSRFDEHGKLVFSAVVSFPTLLAGDPPAVAGMRVDSRGHLLLLAPTPGRPGLELRDYDRDGRLTSARPLVDLARAGHASIDASGALTLLYSYEPASDAGTADPLHAIEASDLARFDANGIPVWNQTISQLLRVNAPGGSGAYPVFATDATAILDWIPAGATPQKVVAAVMDDNGSFSQVVEQENASLGTSVGIGPRSFAAVLQPMSPVRSDFVTTFGVDAPDASHLDGALLSFPDDEIIGIDEQGRLWTWSSASPVVLHAVSRDGRACASWSTTIEICAAARRQTDCVSAAFSVPESGEAYFAAGGVVGLLRLRGLP